MRWPGNCCCLLARLLSSLKKLLFRIQSSWSQRLTDLDCPGGSEILDSFAAHFHPSSEPTFPFFCRIRSFVWLRAVGIVAERKTRRARASARLKGVCTSASWERNDTRQNLRGWERAPLHAMPVATRHAIALLWLPPSCGNPPGAGKNPNFLLSHQPHHPGHRVTGSPGSW